MLLLERDIKKADPRAPGQDHLARRALDQTGHGADDAAFARAVGSDQGNDAAARDGQRYSLHGVNAAVVDVEVLDFEHDVRHGRPPRPDRLR